MWYITSNTIIKIEAGKNQNPTLDTLKKIAKALKVSVYDLIKKTMWWIILIILLSLYLLYRIFVGFFGNWRGTLNQVITQYIAWREMEPNYSDEEIFLVVLDHRYQAPNKNIVGLRKRMYERKNRIKNAMKSEVNNMGVNKYGLPMLIYTCLIIEENSYINQRKEPVELLNPITEEVIKQGFGKYC